MTELASIPSLRGPRPADAVTAVRDVPRRAGSGEVTQGTPRRSFLRGAAAAGTALGFSMLGVFPAARSAYADGYDIWTGACPSYAGSHDCEPGCGPSYVHPNNCAGAWHRTDHPNAWTWYSLRPNDCIAGTGWDGWLWSYSSATRCGSCISITYRCHDGRILQCAEATCYSTNSICRATTLCAR